MAGILLKGDSEKNLNKLVLRAIEVYNRYRSPEATARFIGMEKDGFVIEFEGVFCLSCGLGDYFDDFIYELEDLSRNFEVEIKETEQTGPQSFRVQYRIQDNFSGAEQGEEGLFQEFLQESGLSFREYSASNACTKDVIKFHFRTWQAERKPKPEK